MNDPLASMIQGISISEDASFFATVTTDSNVSVWSLAEKRKITSFKALWSLGGHPLCCTNISKPIIATSSWERGKAAAYDAITGQNLWIVTLSHVQLIAPISHLGSLQLGFSTDDKGVQIRDPFTGAYLKNVRGARYFFSSQDRKHFALVTRRKKIRFCPADGDVLGETFLISFAALDGAYSQTEFLLSEATGPTRCFELNGKELWRIQPPEKQHPVRIRWSHDLRAWVGVVFHYDGPGAPNNVLTTIDQSGFFKLFTLGIGNFEISADGKVIVGSDGNVRSVPEGEIVWRFAD